jgi:cell wall-associated NlpC family hydrolase
MLDKSKLMERTRTYVKAHPPDTNYTISAMQAVLNAGYPEGTNILVQFAMQFDGKESAMDFTHWDKPEIKLPYSNTNRYSFDKSMDCSSFWWAIYKVFFDIDIGNRTLVMYSKWHKKFIPWENRRPGDLILYDFKGRNASHVAGYLGGGLIQHTTNPKDKMHIEADTYAAKSRVGVFRPTTDEQYQSLLTEGEQMLYIGSKGETVGIWQDRLYDVGHGEGLDMRYREQYGTRTANATKAFQRMMKIPETGKVTEYDWAQMAVALANEIKDANAYGARVDADNALLSQDKIKYEGALSLINETSENALKG